MEYMPDLAGQIAGFIYSAGLGFCLGLVYDFFRILFYLLTGSDKKYVAVRDIIYTAVFTGTTFLLLLVMCNGRPMMYIFVGEAIGLGVYFNSLSGSVYRRAKKLLKRFRFAFKVLFTKSLAILWIFLKKYQKIQKFFQKTLENSTQNIV